MPDTKGRENWVDRHQRYRADGIALLPLNALQRRLRDQVEEKVRASTYETASVTCAACDSPQAETLAEKDRYGLTFHVVVCRDCGLIYTNPRMTQAAYAAFYDDEYRALYHGTEQPSEQLFATNWARGQQIASFLKASGVSIEGKRVLDVGCGAGGAIAYLRRHLGCEVYGIDFGSEGVQHGRERHALPLEVADLGTAHVPWQPDLIIYAHVFEHVLDLGEECRRIRRVLNPNGLLYLEVPSVKNIRSEYEWDFLLLLQNAHTYHFTRRTLTNTLQRHGFRCVAGTEFVRALFTQSTIAANRLSDYSDVIDFLDRTERLRTFARYLPRARAAARQMIVRTLGAAGVLPLLKRGLGRVGPPPA